MTFNRNNHPHRRYNPLTGEWVLISPHRTARPWQGEQSEPDRSQRSHFQPDCYLCPGNQRASGDVNPQYKDVYVFNNDFAALPRKGPGPDKDADPLFRAAPAHGECRVVCFSPDHAKTLAEMSPYEILTVVNCWRDQEIELASAYAFVQIFENKGAMMGCSNPHPHGQIWATDFIPTEIEKEDVRQKEWHAEYSEPMLRELVRSELRDGERIVVDTEFWVAIVPYWAAWPFETLLLPKISASRFSELNDAQRVDLALALKQLTVRYDNLFECSFPYSMGWHFVPRDVDARHWQMHAHFYPPLLRSASVRKFMVGFEMLAEAQRDLTPESAAERLRAVSDRHYSERTTS